MHVVSMCITSAEAPPGEPTLAKKNPGGRKWYRTLTSYSARHSLLESESVTLSLQGVMYSLPCPPSFASTRAELRVALVAGCSALT
jgi:hypothetical protein